MSHATARHSRAGPLRADRVGLPSYGDFRSILHKPTFSEEPNVAVGPKGELHRDQRRDFRPRHCVRRRSLPFVNVVDGNCPELLFRELLDGVFRQPAMMNVPFKTGRGG